MRVALACTALSRGSSGKVGAMRVESVASRDVVDVISDMAPLPPIESCGVDKGKAGEWKLAVRNGACCQAPDIAGSLVLAVD